MEFARKHLQKHGWNEGDGLGKDADGMKEAIKVKMKADKKGVGHDPGEEFSFHWWDHVFNKAASKIQVNTTQDGVEVKNTGDTKVSKKKNAKTYDNKAMLYGQFVKGSTLSDGRETMETTVAEHSEDEPEEAAQCLMPSQEDVVFQMCGGRTAHKGARHGLKLNGKLLRIQEQERKLMDTYTAKQNTDTSQCGDRESNHSNLAEGGVVESRDSNEVVKSKKNKKKKRKRQTEEISDDRDTSNIGNSNHCGVDTLENVKIDMNGEVDLEPMPKQKKKKNKKRKRDEADENVLESKFEIEEHSADINDKDVVKTEVNSFTKSSDVSEKRKKKKKNKK